MADYNDTDLETDSLEPAEEGEKEKGDGEGKTPQNLLSFLSCAKKAAKVHWEHSKSAWKEFTHERRSRDGVIDSSYLGELRSFPIFWSTIQTAAPAFYAKTPDIASRRRFENDDPVARLASTLEDRLGTYLINACHFDEAFYAFVKEFLLTDKGCIRIVHTHEEGTQEVRKPVMQAEDGQYYLESGELAVPEEVFQDEQGLFVTVQEPILINQKIYPVSLAFDDVIHTPTARCWNEVKELGFRSYLTRKEFIERFGEEKLEGVSFTNTPVEGESEKQKDDENRFVIPKTEIWEIWCIETKKVYWISECCDELLDEKDDPLGLIGFYPCTPFLCSNKPEKNFYPTPIYIYVRPTIEQLQSAYRKVFELITAVRRRGIVDGSIEALAEAINNNWDNELVVAKNFSQIVEKGGLNNLIQYVPVQELVNAISELIQYIGFFKQEFYEFTGVPDLMRGVAQGSEGIETQQLKSQYASLRFTTNQKQVQEACRSAIEMMTDLAWKVYDDALIDKAVGRQFLTPEEQQLYPQAIELLRNDDSRLIRIDIETDSTSYFNDQQKMQERIQIAQTIIQGLNNVAALAESNPTFVGSALNVLLFTLRGMNMGKSFEGEISRAVKQMIDQANQPPPPPPPDYEQQRIELENRRLDSKMEMDFMKLEQKRMTDQFLAMIEQMQLQLKQQKQEFDQYAKIQELQNEQHKTFLSEREKMIEENRLALEMNSEIANRDVKTESIPQPSTIIVNNVPGAPDPIVVPIPGETQIVPVPTAPQPILPIF